MGELSVLLDIGLKGIKITQSIKKSLDNCIEDESNEVFVEKLKNYIECKYLSFFKIKPLALKVQRDLLEIYYPLTLEPLDCAMKDKKKYELKNINELDINVFFKASSKILIEDYAGMGKSTLMKTLFISSVKKILNGNYNDNHIPFFIELRKFREKESFEDFLLREFLLISSEEKLDNQKNIEKLKKNFFNYNFIFLFDGFDEVLPERKEQIIEEIIRFTNRYTNNYYILSSRSETGLDNFTSFFKYKIKTLTCSEGKELLRNYIKEDDDFYSQLDENEEYLKEFLSTPLLASLIYSAYLYKKDIPSSKEELYSRIYNALYEEHDSNSKGQFSRKGLIERGVLNRILGEFAIKNIKTLNVEYTKYEISLELENILNSYGYNIKIETLLKILTSGICLFGSNGNNYFWCHKSMQEYFIARKIKERDGKENLIKKLVEYNFSGKYMNILSFLYEMEPLIIKKVLYENILEEYGKYKEYNEKIRTELAIFGKAKIYILDKGIDVLDEVEIKNIYKNHMKDEGGHNRSTDGEVFIVYLEKKYLIKNIIKLLIEKKDKVLDLDVENHYDVYIKMLSDKKFIKRKNYEEFQEMQDDEIEYIKAIYNWHSETYDMTLNIQKLEVEYKKIVKTLESDTIDNIF